MPATDASLDALRDALIALADRRAGELVDEAEAEARERVRVTLTDAIADALLDRSGAELATRYLEGGGLEEPAPVVEPTAELSATEPVGEAAETSGAATDESQPAPEGGEVTYVFGVADDAAELAGLPGFDERHDVRAVGSGRTSAVVATVGLDEFGEQALERNLEDLEWIERTARTHETVLGMLAERTTVVPMRLCTIYRDDDQVTAMLAERSEEFGASLERLRGRTEWGVKLIAEPGALDELAKSREGGERETAAGLSPGLAYLDRKQREQRARGDVETVAAEISGDAHARLSAVSVAARLNKLQARELGGHSGDMILNGAYLVDDTDFDRFEGALEALRGELGGDAIEAQLTGPWPAYNFASAEDDEVLRVAG